MAQRTRRAALVVALIGGVATLVAACGSSGDTAPSPGGAGGAGGEIGDGGGADDAGGASDAGGPKDGAAKDGLVDGLAGDGSETSDGAAGSSAAHAIFVTSAAYTGDLVGQANALVAIGNDGGIPTPDGGTFDQQDWQAASDAICQMHARRAGLSGTFIAILGTWGGADAGASDPWARVHDSDGPWALPHGQAVATTVSALSQGLFRTAVDVTETGAVYPYDPLAPGDAVAWVTPAGQGTDCNRWSADTNDGSTIYGHVGAMRYLGAGWRDRSIVSCASAHPLTCLQIGPGGAAAPLPTLPSGAKIAFVTQGSVTFDFAQGAAGDAGADAVHAAADAFCAQSAASAGRAGAFRAFVSSSSSSAKDYFGQQGMSGPWYRPDGFKVADGLTDLFRADQPDGGVAANGVINQIAIDAAGAFRIQPVYTGTNDDGTVGSNCDDFGATSSGDAGAATTRGGLPIFKDFEWASRSVLSCTQFPTGALYCFER